MVKIKIKIMLTVLILTIIGEGRMETIVTIILITTTVKMKIEEVLEIIIGVTGKIIVTEVISVMIGEIHMKTIEGSSITEETHMRIIIEDLIITIIINSSSNSDKEGIYQGLKMYLL